MHCAGLSGSVVPHVAIRYFLFPSSHPTPYVLCPCTVVLGTTWSPHFLEFVCFHKPLGVHFVCCLDYTYKICTTLLQYSCSCHRAEGTVCNHSVHLAMPWGWNSRASCLYCLLLFWHRAPSHSSSRIMMELMQSTTSFISTPTPFGFRLIFVL